MAIQWINGQPMVVRDDFRQRDDGGWEQYGYGESGDMGWNLANWAQDPMRAATYQDFGSAWGGAGDVNSDFYQQLFSRGGTMPELAAGAQQQFMQDPNKSIGQIATGLTGSMGDGSMNGQNIDTSNFENMLRTGNFSPEQSQAIGNQAIVNMQADDGNMIGDFLESAIPAITTAVLAYAGGTAMMGAMGGAGAAEGLAGGAGMASGGGTAAVGSGIGAGIGEGAALGSGLTAGAGGMTGLTPGLTSGAMGAGALGGGIGGGAGGAGAVGAAGGLGALGPGFFGGESLAPVLGGMSGAAQGLNGLGTAGAATAAAPSLANMFGSVPLGNLVGAGASIYSGNELMDTMERMQQRSIDSDLWRGQQSRYFEPLNQASRGFAPNGDQVAMDTSRKLAAQGLNMSGNQMHEVGNALDRNAMDWTKTLSPLATGRAPAGDGSGYTGGVASGQNMINNGLAFGLGSIFNPQNGQGGGNRGPTVGDAYNGIKGLFA
jgi:hypothetical protein